MYEVDENDRVVELEDIPQSSIGAPLPVVLANEGLVVLAYYLENRDPDWDGKTVRMLDADSSDEPIAIVRFQRCLSHIFGPLMTKVFQATRLPCAASARMEYFALITRPGCASWSA